MKETKYTCNKCSRVEIKKNTPAPEGWKTLFFTVGSAYGGRVELHFCSSCCLAGPHELLRTENHDLENNQTTAEKLTDIIYEIAGEAMENRP